MKKASKRRILFAARMATMVGAACFAVSGISETLGQEKEKSRPVYIATEEVAETTYVYIKTLDLSKALAENKRLADLEEKLEADKRRKAEEEAERKRQEEIRKQKEAEEQAKREAEEAERKAAEAKKAQEAAAEVEQTEPQSEMGKVIESIEKSAFAQAVAGETQAAPAAQVVDPFAPKEEPEQEKKYRVRFFADGTKEQLGKLIAFMNENNIKYGKIAKESK